MSHWGSERNFAVNCFDLVHFLLHTNNVTTWRTGIWTLIYVVSELIQQVETIQYKGEQVSYIGDGCQ